MNIISALLPTGDLGFGLYFAPEMVLARYSNGSWSKPEIQKTANLNLHPAAKALHYAQEIFEGLKAFHVNSRICLFRPKENIRRMSRSAEIMAMPPFPEEAFLESTKELVRRCAHLVPQEPGALYLRPTMIATSAQLGVAPSQDYLFYILASPVGGYFGAVKSDKPAGISVWVSDQHVRAAPGGVGAAKTGANYAASLRAVSDCKKKGFANVLFLDAIERRYIEELSGMNVFVVDRGVLKTPPLKDTILDGVTRKSLIQIAKTLEIPFSEEPIAVDQILQGIQNKTLSEIFACGTGASVTAITELGWKNDRIRVTSNAEAGPITTKLYQALINIQTGKRPAPASDWIIDCAQ